MEHETLNLFRKGIDFIQACRKSKTGGFIIRLQRFGFHYNAQEEPSLVKEYGEELFSNTIGEITNITLQLLNGNESQLIKDAQEKAPDTVELLNNKINLVKENIIDEKLTTQFHFFSNCTTSVFKGISLHTIIKPTKSGFPDVISIVSRVDISDNKPETKETSFSFEISPYQLDELIKALNRTKKRVLQLEETRNAKGKIEHYKVEL